MENLRLDDFTKYKFLSNVSLSPNGKFACFIVHTANVEDNKYSSNLWIYNLEENKNYRLTSFNRENNFLWLNDEEIIFSSLREDNDKEKLESGEVFTQFYKININGGEAEKFFKVPMKASSIKDIDRERFIFTAEYNPFERQLEDLSDEEKSKELKRRKEDLDYEVLDEIPFWSNGGGFTNKKRNRLYIYNKETNKYEAITDALMNVEYFNLNSNKSKVIYTGTAFSDKMPIKNNIYIYDINNNKTDKLIGNGEFGISYADFIKDDTVIFLGSDLKRYGVNENGKFYKVNIKTGEITCITPDFERSTWNSVGSDCRYGGDIGLKIDGDYLYFITTEEDSSYLNRIDLDGNIEKVIKNNGSVDDYSVLDGSILFIGLRGLKLQELYRYNNSEIKLTDFNGWVNKEKKLSAPERMSFETDKNVVINGWVLKPVDYDENKIYPAILDIHGGPKTVYGEVYFHEMQYWANEGYFVFFCNPRGSDGRDNDFADIRGKYGTIDYDDLMKFTDKVLEKYRNIDKNRVGVTGGSYGGYMTNWIIGHTDRFAAAASQRSISNWISKFGTTDIGYFFVDDQQGGTPWNNYEKLWWHSPLKYADRVKTPTLFLHSWEDYRCYIPEALQMFTALKYHGVDSRLCMFRGENHELSRSGKPKHRIRRLEEITNWFNHYLK